MYYKHERERKNQAGEEKRDFDMYYEHERERENQTGEAKRVSDMNFGMEGNVKIHARE